MFKKMKMVIAIFFFFVAGTSTASSVTNVSVKKEFREICGFRFARIAGMKMITRKISTDSLRNRIDNERFNACPYKVNIHYLGFSFDLGFGGDVTLDLIENREGYRRLYAGVFEYGDNGWVAPSDNLTIGKNDITVRSLRNGVVVSGIFSRKNNPGLSPDYCFGLSAVGKDGFLTAMECRPTKRELQPIDDLFKKSVVISFPKAAPSQSKNPKSDRCGSTFDCVY
jgi:hypothetical protein